MSILSCEIVCECEYFVNAFCFEIRQCNSDMKIKKNSVNTLTTDILSLNIRSKHSLVLKYVH